MQQASSSSSSSAQRQEKLSTSDIEAPATHQHQPKPALDKNTLQRRIRIGTTGSWVINILLLLAKIAAFAVSRSYSILASVVDSVVDIISQILLAVAAAKAKKWNPKYPTGRSRLESVSVIGCAVSRICRNGSLLPAIRAHVKLLRAHESGVPRCWLQSTMAGSTVAQHGRLLPLPILSLRCLCDTDGHGHVLCACDSRSCWSDY